MQTDLRAPLVGKVEQFCPNGRLIKAIPLPSPGSADADSRAGPHLIELPQAHPGQERKNRLATSAAEIKISFRDGAGGAGVAAVRATTRGR